MQTATIEIKTADGIMPLYEARPDGDARGAIVVIQEAFGVNEHIEDVTRRYADAGYHAVAPHLFHRSGGGWVPYGDMAPIMTHFAALDDDKILADVDATLDYLRDAAHSDTSIGIVGWCMGGRVSFLVAARRAIGAAVGYYGGGIVAARFGSFPPLVGEAATLKTPWLGLFGDDDQSIPVEDVETLRAALTSAPVDTEVVRYEGAGHGFNRDVSDDHRPEAAADANRRALEWFSRHLH
jgi:carboxymethylenebutenolidase